MKKIFWSLLFVYFLPCILSAESENYKNYIVSDFCSFPFFQEACIKKQIGLMSILDYKDFYFPKLKFSAQNTCSGNFEDGWKSFSSVPAFSFEQKLPGACRLDYSVLGNLSLSGEMDFKYNIVPSVMISMPVVSGRKFLSLYNFYGKNNYSSRKKMIELSYNISLREGIYDYISEMGLYLYYRRMSELYSQKYELLEQITRDYETLFNLGKVTAVNVSDKISEKLQFLQSSVEIDGKLIASKKALSELGVSTAAVQDGLNEFLDFWKNKFSGFDDFQYYKDQMELISIDLEHFNYVESNLSAVPYVSAGFSVASLYSESDFPEFSEGSWNFNLGFTIPFRSSFGIKAISSVVRHKALAELEKQKASRRQVCTDTERNGYLELYTTYKRAMDNAAALEKSRLQEYEDLHKIGKLSEYDLNMQRNTSALSDLYADYADLQLLLTRLSFY
ncbi:MAG: TolC family protein [Treponema sp.]|nr:TolC family protein [Treponema sp.]